VPANGSGAVLALICSILQISVIVLSYTFSSLLLILADIVTDLPCFCRYAKDADCKIFQDFLVEEVLLKIVWYQYANFASQTLLESSSQDQDFTNAVAKSAHLQPVLPSPVWDDVVSTIVDILILLGQEEGVLDAFWPGFQTTCVSIILDVSSENASRLARLGDFFSVLHAKIPEIEKTNNMWLLLNVVQPFVAKGFPAIRHSVRHIFFSSSLYEYLFEYLSRRWRTSELLFSELLLPRC